MSDTTISFEVQKDLLRKIETKLKDMKSEAPVVLKNAVNETAKQARMELAEEAQKTYTVKDAGFRKAMKMKNATKSKPTATLIVKGEPLPLKSFQTSKAGGAVRAKVLKGGSMKPLIKGTIKAFQGNVARKGQTRKKTTSKGEAGTQVKHIAIAQRETKERLPMRTMWSNSIPVMIGNEKRVYGIIKPNIQKHLQENISRQIDKILGGN